jgi:hypothetical protein
MRVPLPAASTTTFNISFEIPVGSFPNPLRALIYFMDKHSIHKAGALRNVAEVTHPAPELAIGLFDRDADRTAPAHPEQCFEVTPQTPKRFGSNFEADVPSATTECVAQELALLRAANSAFRSIDL